MRGSGHPQLEVRRTMIPLEARWSFNKAPNRGSIWKIRSESRSPGGLGARLARENAACRTEVACSHVSGLFTQSGWTAGPDRVREPKPHHSSGIDVLRPESVIPQSARSAPL